MIARPQDKEPQDASGRTEQSTFGSCREQSPKAGNEVLQHVGLSRSRPQDPPVAAAAWPQGQGHEHSHAAQEGQDQDILQGVVEAVAEVANAPLQGEGAPSEQYIHQHGGQGLAQSQHDWGLQGSTGVSATECKLPQWARDAILAVAEHLLTFAEHTCTCAEKSDPQVRYSWGQAAQQHVPATWVG